MKLTPTHEQVVIMDLVDKNDVVKIDAGAGAAKTTTLTMIADKQPVTSLYLAFNKAMVEEAGDRFPRWVEVRTTHSLAYREFGVEIKHKLQRPTGKYVNVLGTGTEIARYFKLSRMTSQEGKHITSAGIGLAIKETVNRFEYSADDKIDVQHVSYSPLSKLKPTDKIDIEKYRQLVISSARKLWKLRIDPKEQTLATHDTYLKLFQLSKPDLSKFSIIYLDEAQDTNDCVLDIFNRQKVKRVMVGDRRQQIYSFRGSVNAMAKVNCAEAYLTTSFRFGQAVADIANIILGKKGDKALKGWDKLDTQVVLAHENSEEDYPIPQKHTRLYRTNAELISDAVTLIEQGESVNLEIDFKDFLRLLDSAIALHGGDLMKVKHEELLCYDTWQDYRAEADLIRGEHIRIVEIIEANRQWAIIKALSEHKNDKNADITLTTAHKSKGREWDCVFLAEDFPSGYNNKGDWVGIDEMEENLLYVACTRAKKLLFCNTLVDDIMREKRMLDGFRIDNVRIAAITPNSDVDGALEAIGLGEYDYPEAVAYELSDGDYQEYCDSLPEEFLYMPEV